MSDEPTGTPPPVPPSEPIDRDYNASEEAKAKADQLVERLLADARQRQPPPTKSWMEREGPSPQSAEPAEFPAGFWARLDYLLLHPNAIVESIRREHELPAMIRILLATSLMMAAAYGAVMGATDLLQGA